MSNYPSQDQPSWSGRTAREDQFGRSNRDPYREQDFGSNTRRQWQQEGNRQYGESSYGDSSQDQRDFYEQNSMNSNYGAQRGGRFQHRNEPWPRNEDRENYTAAGEYGRSDYTEGLGSPSTGRYQAAGARRDYQQGSRDWGSGNRGYSPSYRDYGQSYGGPGMNYSQDSSGWRDSQPQFHSPRGYQGDSFAQGDYGNPQYGLQRGSPQPGYFQTGEFSQRGGYTRSEYPEDNSFLYGHPQSRDNQQAGRAMGTQNWQEREGAQRGAFGLQSSHRGRGPQGYSRSDERIKEDVCERLSEHHYIDASQIRVEVSQGVVTLEGTVDDRWQKYQSPECLTRLPAIGTVDRTNRHPAKRRRSTG
jgi:osmotically-inducible protein OsmY